MQIIGNIFTAVIFLSIIGSLFTVVTLFISHVFRCVLPLWFAAAAMALYLVPVLSPDVVLISPEKQLWYREFYIACVVWIIGCALLFSLSLARTVFAGHALKRYRVCGDERIRRICFQCAGSLGLKSMPRLYFGSPGTPVCVAGVLHPSVIMEEEVISRLSDRELLAVFTHEAAHIRRRHLLLERLCHGICILNWISPLAWIARGEFSLHCETDCDRTVLASLKGKMTGAEYALTMVRLMELSSVLSSGKGKRFGTCSSNSGAGALRFLREKRRIQEVTRQTDTLRLRAVSFLLAAVLILAAAFSMHLSREFFYPWPAYSSGEEHAGNYG